jgi:hypothetical protein
MEHAKVNRIFSNMCWHIRTVPEKGHSEPVMRCPRKHFEERFIREVVINFWNAQILMVWEKHNQKRLELYTRI